MVQLIDTSVLVDLNRRGMTFEDLIGIVPNEPVALATITASKLLIGVHCADTPERRLEREAFIERLLDVVPVLSFDLVAARVHAEIASRLMAENKLISAHDLIIAATAIANSCSVLTSSIREFDRIPGLVVKQPSWYEKAPKETSMFSGD